MGRVVVDDGLDRLAGGHLTLDSIEEADEFLVPVPLIRRHQQIRVWRLERFLG